MVYSFTKAQRLRRNEDFKSVLSQTNRCKEDHVILLYRPNEVGHPRLGICVGKRQIKQAVARNRVKRLVRESFRYYQAQFSSVDIVVLVYKDLAIKSNAQITSILGKLWEKLLARYKK